MTRNITFTMIKPKAMENGNMGQHGQNYRKDY